MKNFIIKLLIVLLIFLVSAFLIVLSFAGYMGAFADNPGIGTGVATILGFLIAFGISWLSHHFFEKKIGNGVLITLGLVVLVLAILNGSNTTIKFTIKVLPFYISWIMGLLAGYYFYRGHQKKNIIVIALLMFPVIMAAGVNDLWHHKIEYGNWTGNVKAETIAPFELLDKQGLVVNNEDLKGKVVLFDFWFVRCPPCWVKFPELQRIYEKYEDSEEVALYAVNRDDDPEILFTKIEEKGYTFPVLRGTQELMDTLGIYKYPTVMILNQEGEMVFMGILEDAEKRIESLLDSGD